MTASRFPAAKSSMGSCAIYCFAIFRSCFACSRRARRRSHPPRPRSPRHAPAPLSPARRPPPLPRSLCRGGLGGAVAGLFRPRPPARCAGGLLGRFVGSARRCPAAPTSPRACLGLRCRFLRGSQRRFWLSSVCRCPAAPTSPRACLGLRHWFPRGSQRRFWFSSPTPTPPLGFPSPPPPTCPWGRGTTQSVCRGGI